MSDLKTQLEDQLSELQRLTDRAAELNGTIKRLEVELKEAHQEHLGIVGNHFHGYGKIQKVKDEIEVLKRKISHSDKPVVVWVNEPKGYSFDKGKIVHKVTAKRIHVCQPGHTNCEMYNKDGTAVGSWSGANSINIEATFGGPCPESLK